MTEHLNTLDKVPQEELRSGRLGIRIAPTAKQRLAALAAQDRVSLSREIELMITREWWRQCGSYMDQFIPD